MSYNETVNGWSIHCFKHAVRLRGPLFAGHGPRGKPQYGCIIKKRVDGVLKIRAFDRDSVWEVFVAAKQWAANH